MAVRRRCLEVPKELRDHLESRVADLLESGMDKNSAVMQAVEEFGVLVVVNCESVADGLKDFLQDLTYQMKKK